MANGEEETVSLRQYFEKILDVQDTAQQRALELHSTEIDRRLAELNKVREEQIHDRILYVLKTTYDPAHRDLETRLGQLGNRVTTIESGNKTWIAAIGIFFTIIQIGGGLVMYFLLKH